MKILVTGFDPFGGDAMNPAYEAVKLLPETIAGAQVITMEVPTVFGKCGQVLREGILKHKPDAVLCIGQAGGRSSITVERVGINLVEARIPDNEKNQPANQTIEQDGENAYFATLPVKAMVKNIRAHGIPSHLSYTAGTFVCNDILYRLLYMLNKEFPDVRGGFIHVPFDTEQVVERPIGTPSMPVSCIAEALQYAVEAIALNEQDIELPSGEIC